MAWQDVAPHKCKNIPAGKSPIQADGIPSLLTPSLGARFEALQQQALGIQRHLNQAAMAGPPPADQPSEQQGCRELAMMAVMLRYVAFELPEGKSRTSILEMLDGVFQRNMGSLAPPALKPSMSPISPLPSASVKEPMKKTKEVREAKGRWKGRRTRAARKESISPTSPKRGSRVEQLFRDHPLPPSPPGCLVSSSQVRYRWKQVAIGLSTAGYKNMVKHYRAAGKVPPEVPNVFENNSKREFAFIIHDWRKMLRRFEAVETSESTHPSDKVTKERSSDDGRQAEDTPGHADSKSEESEDTVEVPSGPELHRFASTMPVTVADVCEDEYSKSIG